MIAPAKASEAPRSTRPVPAWHSRFVELAPQIERYARAGFRYLHPEARAEAVQNALCLACAAVARLAELDKLDLCYPAALARFAIAQTRSGRMLGRPQNCNDISSEACRRKKGVVLERLDKYDSRTEAWEEFPLPDRTRTPADLAASRLDFSAWLRTLTPRVRTVAMQLAAGETTTSVSRRHHVSPGRVSQLRRELHAAWCNFHGESDLYPPGASSRQ